MFHIINADVQSLGVNSENFQSEIVKGQKFNRPVATPTKKGYIHQRKMSNISETEDVQGDGRDTPRDLGSDYLLDVPTPNVIVMPQYAKYRNDNNIQNEAGESPVVDIKKFQEQ